MDNKRLYRKRVPPTVPCQAERRKYPRIKKNLRVFFRRIDALRECESAATKDLGAGGFRIEVAFLGKPLSANQPIEMIITDPQKEATAIRAIGYVAWIEEREDKHCHELGIKLTYLDAEGRKQFQRYLSE